MTKCAERQKAKAGIMVWGKKINQSIRVQKGLGFCVAERQMMLFLPCDVPDTSQGVGVKEWGPNQDMGWEREINMENHPKIKGLASPWRQKSPIDLT